MKERISADPFRCRMWEFHNRFEHHVNETTCRAEIESFLNYGQLVPVLGRRLCGDPKHDVELIFGARRLFVARHLNKPLVVELCRMTDAEAFIAMEIENRQRLDVSPYERGMNYLTCLRRKLYKSQDDIARALKISSSQVSRLLKLAHLPTVVVAAFNSPTDICETWAHELDEALSDPRRRERTCARARAIAAMPSRPAARDIFRELLSASTPGRKVTVRKHDDVVTGRDGTPLFRIRYLASAVALLLPIDRLPASRLAVVRSALANALEEPVAIRAEALTPTTIIVIPDLT